MTKNKNISPLPWEDIPVLDSKFNITGYSISSEFNDIAFVESLANAEYIVKAVNNYDKLMEFVNSITDLSNDRYDYLDRTVIVRDAQQLLKEIEEGKND